MAWCHRVLPPPAYSMNNYLFLVSEREHGQYNEYMRRGLISSSLILWLDVYEFHLAHTSASTWFIANKFGISQKHVRNIYAYMESGKKNED